MWKSNYVLNKDLFKIKFDDLESSIWIKKTDHHIIAVKTSHFLLRLVVLDLLHKTSHSVIFTEKTYYNLDSNKTISNKNIIKKIN